MPGWFITGTDTGVGKTVLAASILAALRARGQEPHALKPIVTGIDEEPDRQWPPDHELLARAAGSTPEEVALYTFGPPVSPHLAAELSGRPIDPERITAVVSARQARGVIVVEGVGGLLVPLREEYLVRDLAREVGLPVLIAARPGLGTINHTLLTLQAARAAELEVAAVVLTPWPQQPDEVARSNRATIEGLGVVAVLTLSEIECGDPELLAEAGEPLVAWLDRRPHR